MSLSVQRLPLKAPAQLQSEEQRVNTGIYGIISADCATPSDVLRLIVGLLVFENLLRTFSRPFAS